MLNTTSRARYCAIILTYDRTALHAQFGARAGGTTLAGQEGALLDANNSGLNGRLNELRPEPDPLGLRQDTGLTSPDRYCPWSRTPTHIYSMHVYSKLLLYQCRGDQRGFL